ncbi:MAG: hypothetical protein F4018_03430 [Acidobacteria bacterium]|nr:hypothetical protein [Acidobacteriota bacterium]MYK87460.1 hypothetical protein [Acidobacteriota bacterium]
MQIDTMPVHAAVSDPQTGEPRQVAAALLLMHDPADDGLTTGWYWTEVPRNPEPQDLKSRQRWTEAVAGGQGPFRDANAALAAAQNHSPQAAELAGRLEQAAELLRGGEIEATPAAIAEWLEKANDGAEPIGPDPNANSTPENPEEARSALEGETPDPETDDDAVDETLDTNDAADTAVH